MTAYGFSTSGTAINLFGKNDGGSEHGVGLAYNREFSRDSDHEIMSNTFVQLDLANILNPFSLTIGSTQYDQGFNVCFSSTLGTLGTSCTAYTDPGADPFTTALFTKPGGNNYVSVTALGPADANHDVLLDSMNTNLTPTPEPSSLILLGTGLFGLVWMVRSKHVHAS